MTFADPEPTAASLFTRDELLGRIRNLQERLREQSLDGALLLQRVDMAYYTGSIFQGAVAIPAHGDARIFSWRRFDCFGDSTPAEVEPVKGMGHLLSVLGGSDISPWKLVGLEEDVLPVALYKSLAAKVWPHAELADISSAIRTQRSVKSLAELESVRASGRALSAGFTALPGILRDGIPEYEAQAQMDVVMRRHGDQAVGRARAFNSENGGVIAAGAHVAVDNAFDGPVAQPGRNPIAPAGSGNGIIRPGIPVICDHTAGVNGYQTDMTRTFCLGPVEKLNPKFISAHEFCVELHRILLDKIRSGAIPSVLYTWAVTEAEHAGFGANFMNRGHNRVRFVGHGVGLELDEWPVLAKGFDTPLEAGTVLAVEPKIIFDDGGVGVEDTLIVRDNQPAEVVTEMEYGILEV